MQRSHLWNAARPQASVSVGRLEQNERPPVMFPGMPMAGTLFRAKYFTGRFSCAVFRSTGHFRGLMSTRRRVKSSIGGEKLSSIHKLKFSAPATLSVVAG
jgi:hypothetical protein